MLKTCVKCQKAYPISSFYRASANPDGFSVQCKPCKNLYTKNYRLKQRGKPSAAVPNLKTLLQTHSKIPRNLIPEDLKQCTKCLKVLVRKTQFYQTKKGTNPICIACTKVIYKQTTGAKLEAKKHAKKQAKKDLIDKFKSEVDLNIFYSPWEFSLESAPFSFEETYRKVFPNAGRVPVTQAEHEYLTGTELTDIYLRRAILVYGFKVLVIAYANYNPFEYAPYNLSDALKNARFKHKILSTTYKKEFFTNHDKFRKPIYISRRFINYCR